MRVYGEAELVEREGRFSGLYLRIKPAVSWSFTIAGDTFEHGDEAKTRRTVHS